MICATRDHGLDLLTLRTAQISNAMYERVQICPMVPPGWLKQEPLGRTPCHLALQSPVPST